MHLLVYCPFISILKHILMPYSTSRDPTQHLNLTTTLLTIHKLYLEVY